MSNEVWYLLFGGTSDDGAGPGKYIGRTTDYEEAREHYEECKRNPYSVGYVMIVTDTRYDRAWDQDWKY
jgi:hypothetical protein